MQRLVIGTTLEVIFDDRMDIQFLEEKIADAMREGFGWLTLNHPDEAGTQAKVLISPGADIAILRRQGPARSDPRFAESWLFT
ncbi:hypothetical protein [Leifsonia virtsii]|uniref:Uncharacterized protein n=1 Tax=Leifsonia virtsii TaxID=3035915 RepID=A0ABT8ISZ3_9MICO|nr:hypothetical protein [Leifsonia virtsii]MDN4595898.1 hypothetical protein [Leifsonia virtsii]